MYKISIQYANSFKRYLTETICVTYGTDGRDERTERTYVRTDSGDTICPAPIENGGGIEINNEQKHSLRCYISNKLYYRIRSYYRTYPWKRTVQQFRRSQTAVRVILSTSFIIAYAVGNQWNCLDFEAIQMSTHNICFYKLVEVTRMNTHNICFYKETQNQNI